MPREEEVKFRFKDIAHSQEIFRMLCYHYGTPVITLEKNRLFDTPQGELRSKGWILRLRSVLTFDMARNVRDCMRFILTVKKPTNRKSVRWEEEMDVGQTTNDVRRVISRLGKLGFTKVFFYEKLRSDFRIGGLVVTLAELPLLGYWLEIEGKEREISACARLLGFKRKDAITSDFRTLWEEFARANNLPAFKKLTFPRKRRSPVL